MSAIKIYQGKCGTYMLHTMLAQNGDSWHSEPEGSEYEPSSIEGQLQNELKLAGNGRNL
jgi:hypothetical protein